MDFQKFTIELFGKVKNWIEPEIKQLRSQLQEKDDQIKSLKSYVNELKLSIPSEFDKDSFLQEIKDLIPGKIDIGDIQSSINDKSESLLLEIAELRDELFIQKESIPENIDKDKLISEIKEFITQEFEISEDDLISLLGTEKSKQIIKEQHSELLEQINDFNYKLEEISKSIPQEVNKSEIIDELNQKLAVVNTIRPEDFIKFFDDDGAEIIKSYIDPILKDIEEIKSIPAPKDGENGKDGRDGLDIEILPAIDSDKSYPRGTYAMHNGGLWRSHTETLGMRGWDCIVKGFPTINVEQKSERSFVIDFINSSGDKDSVTFDIPVIIYRGVWKEGLYLKGDTVTRAGSIWHADKDTETIPGSPDSDWTLAVKKGRDGRNGDDK